MSFTSNIPITGQTLGNSRPLVNGNFTNYFNVVSQDHISPNLTGQGKHNKSTYVEQGSDPATLADEIAVYSKTVNAITEQFLRREGNGTAIQMTVGSPVIGTPGSTFLPGGIIIKWGTFNSGVDGGTVNFTGTFPNNCWNVQMTPQSAAVKTFGIVNVVTTSGFTYSSSSSTAVVGFYVAIGN